MAHDDPTGRGNVPGGPDQSVRRTESVWDYPRPPALRPVRSRVTVHLAGQLIVDTTTAIAVLETSHPPTIYLPRAAFTGAELRPADGPTTWCEFKGRAHYLDVVVGDSTARRAGWTYPQPTPAYTDLAGMVALYPSRMELCTLAGETVQAQDGDFYGGWITSAVTGPFKGAPGTLGW
ncbi:MAG: DUF427 domain-containing protein [Actinobacteria bacterium]|nr:DUF427 domain-containing protein [Actinomycetota bacterium]